MHYYIQKDADANGNHGVVMAEDFPQSVELPEELVEAYLSCNGFALLEVDETGRVVTSVKPNTDAWEAWKASLPPAKPFVPTETEQLRADVDYLAIMTGVTL